MNTGLPKTSDSSALPAAINTHEPPSKDGGSVVLGCRVWNVDYRGKIGPNNYIQQRIRVYAPSEREAVRIIEEAFILWRSVGVQELEIVGRGPAHRDLPQNFGQYTSSFHQKAAENAHLANWGQTSE